MKWEKLLSTTRGRELDKGPKPKNNEDDPRSEFRRDYDRAIFCTPFRRLQDKTQVFPMDPNDSVRTRLTHSLEVASVSSGIAKATAKKMVEENKIDSGQVDDISTIAATCGLIHDFGNPPFGHSGEKAIAGWFKKKLDKDKNFFKRVTEKKLKALEIKKSQYAQDFLNFEGNAQTLRLVTRLQVLADFHGLNLTCGTLSAACKYIAPSNKVDTSRECHERSKPGFFASENDFIKKLRNETGTGEARNPITFLVEAADDCVYNTVDLEDGVKKNLLDWVYLKRRLRRIADNKKLIDKCIGFSEKKVKSAKAKLSGRAKDSALVQYFRVAVIKEVVPHVANAFMKHYDEIMSGEFHKALLDKGQCNPGAASLIKACNKICREVVYCSQETLKLELMGRKIIHDLMDLFWEGASEYDGKQEIFPKKVCELMSENYKLVFKETKKDLPKKYRQMQLLTDYICGMTDTFAYRLHKSLISG